MLGLSAMTKVSRTPMPGDGGAAEGLPRISIIVASLDAGPMIGRCLNSIAECGYPAVEVIVADGGSKDGTLESLEASRERMGGMLTWISEPDGGIADAWNKAVAMAKGDWCSFSGPTTRSQAPPCWRAWRSISRRPSPASGGLRSGRLRRP
jgi:Glycosyltransferases involved in cell wall biogenesis